MSLVSAFAVDQLVNRFLPEAVENGLEVVENPFQVGESGSQVSEFDLQVGEKDLQLVESNPVSPIVSTKPSLRPMEVRGKNDQKIKLGTATSVAMFAIHCPNAFSALSQTVLWRNFLSRMRRRVLSSNCGSRSKVILAGWKFLASAWQM